MGDFFKIERKICGKENPSPSSKTCPGRMILHSAISYSDLYSLFTICEICVIFGQKVS
jgi:hypothetical protein